MAKRILVADDETSVREAVGYALQQEGFEVTLAQDGEDADAKLADGDNFDLLILDIMMPGKSGLDVCREVRARSPVPIILLTAKDSEVDKVVGLEVGADDYLPKPFNPRELLARIRAVLRRFEAAARVPLPPEEGALLFSGWRLDPAARRLTDPEGRDVALTAAEFNLLLAFAQRPNRVLTRDQLLDLSRGRDAAPFDRSVDVQISRLRRKIEQDPARPELIRTVRGGGYAFSAVVEREAPDARSSG